MAFIMGQRVKCIKNDEYESNLTIGKEYVILEINPSIHTNRLRNPGNLSVKITDDVGRQVRYFSERFEAVNESTDQQQPAIIYLRSSTGNLTRYSSYREARMAAQEEVSVPEYDSQEVLIAIETWSQDPLTRRPTRLQHI